MDQKKLLLGRFATSLTKESWDYVKLKRLSSLGDRPMLYDLMMNLSSFIAMHLQHLVVECYLSGIEQTLTCYLATEVVDG